MKQIKITTTAELIEFIESSNYEFDKYVEIIQAFTGMTFFVIGENSKPKLIEYIKDYESKNETNLEMPLFIK